MNTIKSYLDISWWAAKKMWFVYVAACFVVGAFAIPYTGISFVANAYQDIQSAHVRIYSEQPPSQEFMEWVQTVPRKSYTGRVRWTGKLIFVIPPDEGFAADSSVSIRCIPMAPHACSSVLIEQVRVSAESSEEEARESVRFETVGRYDVFEWWLDHQDYISYQDPEFETWVDGMGYLTVGTEQQQRQWGRLVAYWDGHTPPTCQHLGLIQWLWEHGYTIGSGVKNLMQQQGCE